MERPAQPSVVVDGPCLKEVKVWMAAHLRHGQLVQVQLLGRRRVYTEVSQSLFRKVVELEQLPHSHISAQPLAVGCYALGPARLSATCSPAAIFTGNFRVSRSETCNGLRSPTNSEAGR